MMNWEITGAVDNHDGCHEVQLKRTDKYGNEWTATGMEIGGVIFDVENEEPVDDWHIRQQREEAWCAWQYHFLIGALRGLHHGAPDNIQKRIESLLESLEEYDSLDKLKE